MARSKTHYGVSVRDLISAGMLNPGDLLTCEPRRGEVYSGRVEADGSLVLDGRRFPSPSKAASTVAGNSRDGWETIKANGRPLKEIRDEYIRTSHGLVRAPLPRDAARAPATPQVADRNSAATPSVTLAEMVHEHVQDVRARVASRIQNLSAGRFEELVAEVLSALGYMEVRRTGGTGDGNIDVIGKYHPPFTNVALRVQVKHRRNGPNVGPTDVAAFRDRAGGVDHLLLLVTNVDFTDGARETASEQGRQVVHLLRGQDLVEVMVDNRVGVMNGLLGLPELDKAFWNRFSESGGP